MECNTCDKEITGSVYSAMGMDMRVPHCSIFCREMFTSGDRVGDIRQLEKGQKIVLFTDSKIVKTSVKKLLDMKNRDGQWWEVLIDRKNNKFFNFSMYLNGKSWVKNLYIYGGIDKRLN